MRRSCLAVSRRSTFGFAGSVKGRIKRRARSNLAYRDTGKGEETLAGQKEGLHCEEEFDLVGVLLAALVDEVEVEQVVQVCGEDVDLQRQVLLTFCVIKLRRSCLFCWLGIKASSN